MVQEDAGQGYYWTDSAGLQGYLQAGKCIVTSSKFVKAEILHMLNEEHIVYKYVQFGRKKLMRVRLIETIYLFKL